MRIYIATISRDAVLVEISDSAKVSDLKKEIAAKIPDAKLTDQILKFESKILLDTSTMKQSGITENSVIELLTLRKNSIFIKMATDGKIHELEIDFSKNIDALKKQISQSLNIPSECQRLFLTELKNKDVLSSKMIEPGATIHLFAIDLNLKLNIVHTKSTFPLEQIEIPKGHKIFQLKDLIASKWKLPSGHQSLSFNSQVLENKKTLADYNIQNMSTINVKQINIELYVDVSSLGRNRITVHALMTDTIDVVKKKIQSSLKIGTESQKLIWNGTVLNDRDTLTSKAIVSGSTLSLIPIIQLFKINVLFDMVDVAIETHLNETVAELKQKVQLITLISSVQQILSLGGIELQNDKKLFEYGLKGGSTLTMGRRDTFELIVETVAGYDITVRVHRSDQIRYIKHQLAKLDKSLSVAAYEHALLFRTIILNDDATLAIYGIEPGTKLTMIKIRLKLFIHSEYRDAIEVEMSATDNVLDLKKYIASQINGITVLDQELKFQSKTLIDTNSIHSSGIQHNSVIELKLPNCYKISIKTEDNYTHILDVQSRNTIELVKQMLNRLLKITVEEQCLLFNGVELKNDDLLTEKFIKPGATINLIAKLRLNIIQRSGEVECIELRKSSTIAQLKQMILVKYKISQDYQILTYNGVILDQNDKTIAEYKINNLSEIIIRAKNFEIFLQSPVSLRITTLYASPIDTIGQLKGQLEAKFKINKSEQRILWKGHVVHDDATLSSEGINNGSILGLTIPIFKLNIQNGPEDKIQIEATSIETVVQLKIKLLNAINIPIDQQILIVNNKNLDDSKLLIDYGLFDGADIVLERRDSFELVIEFHSNNLIMAIFQPTPPPITIRVHRTDSISNIKAQICRRTLIKPEHQRLTYHGRHLEGFYNTLEIYEITKCCTIRLVNLK